MHYRRDAKLKTNSFNYLADPQLFSAESILTIMMDSDCLISSIKPLQCIHSISLFTLSDCFSIKPYAWDSLNTLLRPNGFMETDLLCSFQKHRRSIEVSILSQGRLPGSVRDFPQQETLIPFSNDHIISYIVYIEKSRVSFQYSSLNSNAHFGFLSLLAHK